MENEMVTLNYSKKFTVIFYNVAVRIPQKLALLDRYNNTSKTSLCYNNK